MAEFSLMHCTICLSIILCSVCVKGEIRILKEPNSLLIPVGKTAMFSCTAYCNHTCTGVWIIDGLFPQDGQWNGSEYTITLLVNALKTTNNTDIQCEYSSDGYTFHNTTSNPAELLVIPQPPVSPNPKLEVNSTHLILHWSPPFLWPGHRIQYYNISFTNESDGSVCHYRVNGTYTSSLLSFTKELNQCTAEATEIELSITPYNTSTPLHSINITDTITRDVRGDVHLLNETVLNTSVYFHTDGRPVVVVYIQLPETLYYYHLSYSLTVENRQDDVITQLDSQHYVRSGVIKEAIEGNLKKDQTYNLKVEMSICLHSNTLMLTFNTSTTNSYYGSQMCDVSRDLANGVFIYQLAMYVSVGMAAMFFSVMVVLIACVCFCYRKRKREKRVKDTKNRLCKSMIHNPIYDGNGTGPVYESVHPVRPDNVFRITEINKENLTSDQDKSGSNSPGYSTLHDKTGPSDSNKEGMNVSTSAPAIPPKNVTCQKKTGKERNKLQLTLSLGTSNNTSRDFERMPVHPFPPEAYMPQMKNRSMYMNQANIGSLYSSVQPGECKRINYGDSEYYDV